MGSTDIQDIVNPVRSQIKLKKPTEANQILSFMVQTEHQKENNNIIEHTEYAKCNTLFPIPSTRSTKNKLVYKKYKHIR